MDSLEELYCPCGVIQRIQDVVVPRVLERFRSELVSVVETKQDIHPVHQVGWSRFGGVLKVPSLLPAFCIYLESLAPHCTQKISHLNRLFNRDMHTFWLPLISF
jgi:hypothetical protein